MENQENIILLDIKKIGTRIFQLSIFVAIAFVAPYFGNQLITGSIVNALLFICVIVMGIESALLLCLIPSLISIYTGLLPLALAPMIPFIIMGNALMVLIFWTLKNRSFWLGAIFSSIIKFIFLWSVAMLLLPKMFLMFSWPQLVTSLLGVCISFLFLKILKFNKK